MNALKKTRVGFLLYERDWLGGRNYLRNLFIALDLLPKHPITPVLFTGMSQGIAPQDFPGAEIATTSMLDRKAAAWLVRKLIARSTARDLILTGLLKQYDIDVLSHSPRLGPQTSIKTIGWIPDFQHVHLPQFFEPAERTSRNREFEGFCKRCDRIIVSSECARADLIKFAPHCACKADLLRFVAAPLILKQTLGLEELQRHYGFNGPYFLLPNQFWAHKNHRVVISALHELKRNGRPLLVLATGSTMDYRNPHFFDSLMQYAAECGVLDYFRVLGKVPTDHLVGLMKDAVALINPSHFEGWSTSVEEAKSMGKQIVLSDIPVHREQAPERGLFFPSDDPHALANMMIAAYEGFDHDQDAAMQKRAQENLATRQLEFALTYQRIVQKTLEIDS